MRKQFLLIFASLVVWQGLAAAIPAQITYQGTLKQSGVPVTGNKHVHFAITDVTGNQQYGNAVDTITMVTQGLFSVPLTFTGVDWEHVTPYIQVTVENNVMGAPEPITTTVYATLASSVVDGSITTTKLSDASVTQQKIEPTSFQASGVGLVPQGAIMMFGTPSCPNGWTRFTALDNRFPLGTDPSITSPGTTGGSSTHHHSIAMGGAHSHVLNVDGISKGTQSNTSNIGWTSFNGALFVFTPGSGSDDWYQADKTTNSAGEHDHGGVTGDTSSMPPFMNLLFCQKQ